MCVVSMIYDHYYDKWREPPYRWPPTPTVPNYFPPPVMPTRDEIDEFRKLLERAREYDKRTGQPDCELEEKRKKVKDLAEQLGVDVSFV